MLISMQALPDAIPASSVIHAPETVRASSSMQTGSHTANYIRSILITGCSGLQEAGIRFDSSQKNYVIEMRNARGELMASRVLAPAKQGGYASDFTFRIAAAPNSKTCQLQILCGKSEGKEESRNEPEDTGMPGDESQKDEAAIDDDLALDQPSALEKPQAAPTDSTGQPEPAGPDESRQPGHSQNEPDSFRQNGTHDPESENCAQEAEPEKDASGKEDQSPEKNDDSKDMMDPDLETSQPGVGGLEKPGSNPFELQVPMQFPSASGSLIEQDPLDKPVLVIQPVQSVQKPAPKIDKKPITALKKEELTVKSPVQAPAALRPVESETLKPAAKQEQPESLKQSLQPSLTVPADDALPNRVNEALQPGLALIPSVPVLQKTAASSSSQNLSAPLIPSTDGSLQADQSLEWKAAGYLQELQMSPSLAAAQNPADVPVQESAVKPALNTADDLPKEMSLQNRISHAGRLSLSAAEKMLNFPAAALRDPQKVSAPKASLSSGSRQFPSGRRLYIQDPSKLKVQVDHGQIKDVQVVSQTTRKSYPDLEQAMQAEQNAAFEVEARIEDSSSHQISTAFWTVICAGKTVQEKSVLPGKEIASSYTLNEQGKVVSYQQEKGAAALLCRGFDPVESKKVAAGETLRMYVKAKPGSYSVWINGKEKPARVQEDELGQKFLPIKAGIGTTRIRVLRNGSTIYSGELQSHNPFAVVGMIGPALGTLTGVLLDVRRRRLA